jgi:hypothetical protein
MAAVLAYIGPGLGWIFSWHGLLVVVITLATVGAVIAEYRRRHGRP